MEILATGPAGIRPGFGLSFESLPAEREQTPFTIINDQMGLARRQIYEQFDIAREELNSSNLQPKEYEQRYAELLAAQKQQELELQHQIRSKTLAAQHIMDLVRDGQLDKIQGQRILWQLAGLDKSTIGAMFPDEEEQDPLKQYKEVRYMQNQLGSYVEAFKGKKSKLYHYHLTSAGDVVWDEPATPEEELHYVEAFNLLDYYNQKELELFKKLGPENQEAVRMQRALQQKLQGERDGFSFKGLGFAATGPGAIRQIWKMGGHFLRQLRGQKPTVSEKTIPNIRIRRNPRTGEEIISYDGGKTWQKR